jgi:hypothetical protein
VPCWGLLAEGGSIGMGGAGVPGGGEVASGAAPAGTPLGVGGLGVKEGSALPD